MAIKKEKIKVSDFNAILSVQETAKLLNTSHQEISRWIHTGKCPMLGPYGEEFKAGIDYWCAGREGKVRKIPRDRFCIRFGININDINNFQEVAQ